VKALVSGAHGFIAYHLIRRLVDEGHTVDGLDKRMEHETPQPPYATFYRVDLSRLHEYPMILDRFKEYDAVYHLAACTDQSAGCTQHYRDSVQATWNLLKYTGECPFIFVSSAAVYGGGTRLRELSKMKPTGPYGYGKAVAERLVEASGRPYTILRPGTVMGEYGRSIVNTLVKDAVEGAATVLYNGGENRRSLIDVADIVEALAEPPPGTYNLGPKEDTRIADAARLASEIIPDMRWSTTDERPGWLEEEVTLYSGKLRRTGWKSMVPLSETIKRLHRHYSEKRGNLP
jgi:nucleoside-diphosphate-sugar epimerase